MKNTVTWAAAAAAAGVIGGAALGYWEARPWAANAAGHAFQAPPAEASGHAHGDHDHHDHDHGDHEHGDPDQPVAQSAGKPAGDAGPQLALADTTFHFGSMETGTLRRHTFAVQNRGGKPLTVNYVSHTCKCTGVWMDGQEVEPGATAKVPAGGIGEITLQWVAPSEPNPFRHGASFTTNDPARSRFELNVEGDIVASTTLEPSLLAFGTVHGKQPSRAEVVVMSFLEPDVRIESYEVTDAALAEQITIEVEPLSADRLPNPKAKAGVRVSALYTPSGELGPFSGDLRLETNLQQATSLNVPIFGAVKGDIAIHGTGWVEAAGQLRMGAVRSVDGAQSRLLVNLRGEHAAQTELSVESVDPPELAVTLGDRRAIRPGLEQVALTVAVPPGTRPLVRAGEDVGGEGLIVLATTHPDAPKVRLRVTVTVLP
ncbi:MAG TPA: DUF1573 domain-containing protein [Lacipirellulaceae bacterium]|nr:DUF1573 domain-containing protein [Lacipirellulaceae bacterium]